jgi:hypothetical protein
VNAIISYRNPCFETEQSREGSGSGLCDSYYENPSFSSIGRGGSEGGNGGLKKTGWLDLREDMPPSLEALRIKRDHQPDLSHEDVIILLQTLIDLVRGHEALPPKRAPICKAANPSDIPGSEALLIVCEKRGIEYHRFFCVTAAKHRTLCRLSAEGM